MGERRKLPPSRLCSPVELAALIALGCSGAAPSNPTNVPETSSPTGTVASGVPSGEAPGWPAADSGASVPSQPSTRAAAVGAPGLAPASAKATSAGAPGGPLELLPVSAEAQLELAQRYETGRGVPKDRTMAAQWARAAALGGSAQHERRFLRKDVRRSLRDIDEVGIVQFDLAACTDLSADARDACMYGASSNSPQSGLELGHHFATDDNARRIPVPVSHHGRLEPSHCRLAHRRPRVG